MLIICVISSSMSSDGIEIRASLFIKNLRFVLGNYESKRSEVSTQLLTGLDF